MWIFFKDFLYLVKWRRSKWRLICKYSKINKRMYFKQTPWSYMHIVLSFAFIVLFIITVILQYFWYDLLQKCRREFQSHYKVKLSMAHLSINTSVISVWSKWLLVVFCCKTSPYNKTPPGYLGRPRECQDVRTLHTYFTYRNNLRQSNRV